MSGNVRRSRRRPPPQSSWDRVATWYDGWVGNRGSRYHQALAVPALISLLEPQPGEEILDIGAGQGVLAPYVHQRAARYTGVDASPRLIGLARRRHGDAGQFFVGDARRLVHVRGLSPHFYDAATFLFSIQDMDPLDQVLASAAWALKPSGRIVLAMTHPAFRVPRHSGWGYDESRNLHYRRVDAYLTRMSVPMKVVSSHHPATRSFHRPLSSYVNDLARVGFAVDEMVELPDLAEVRGRRSVHGLAANADIPLLLAMRAIHQG